MLSITPYTLKPPLGSAILDPTASPLSKGLVFFAPVNEGAGTITNDVAGGLAMAITATAPWTTGSMTGLACSSNGRGAFSALSSALSRLTMPCTLVLALRNLGTQNFTPILGGMASSAQNATGPAFILGAALAVDLCYTTAGTNVSAGYTLSKGVDTVLGASLTTSTQNVYVTAQGQTVNTLSATNAASLTSWGAGARVSLGDYTGVSRNSNCLIYWMAIWNRALSSFEHASIAQYPWQVFAPLYGSSLLQFQPRLTNPVMRPVRESTGSDRRVWAD